MPGGRKWLRKAAMLLALCAGGVAASTPPTASARWTADPDEQFLLDVNIRQLKLGDGVRAYNTPEGTCVVLGDFLTALDVPVKVDLAARKASGWAFKESNRIAIDYGGGTASYSGKSEPLASGTVRETPDGWCVQTSALTRWFGIGVKPVTSGAVLVLESDAKLPVELAMERQERAKHLHPASFDLKSLPQVRLPYRMWRAPALDFVVSAGVTYRAKDGVRGRSPELGLRRRRNRCLVLRCAAHHDPEGRAEQLAPARLPFGSRRRIARSAQGDPFRLRRRRRFRQQAHRLGRERPRRRHHQPPADDPGGVRPHALRRRSAERMGSRNLPQRGASRFCQVEFDPALCL